MNAIVGIFYKLVEIFLCMTWP